MRELTVEETKEQWEKLDPYIKERIETAFEVSLKAKPPKIRKSEEERQARDCVNLIPGSNNPNFLSKKDKNHYVYILRNPLRLDKDGVCSESFYVGRGAGDRIYHHIRDALNPNLKKSSKNSFKEAVIRKILKSGLKVGVVILFYGEPPNVVNAKEIEFINKYGRRDLGTGTLTNLKSGEPYVKRERQTNKKLSEEHKQKLREYNLKFGKQSEQAREKNRLSHLGKRKIKIRCLSTNEVGDFEFFMQKYDLTYPQISKSLYKNKKNNATHYSAGKQKLIFVY